MSVLPVGFGSSASTAYQIANSLRFDGVNDYLSRTFGTPTSGTTWTYSIWVKRGQLDTLMDLLSGNSAANATLFEFQVNNTIYLQIGDGSTAYGFGGAAVLRDPTAWYHFLAIANTTQATATLTGTATDRLRIYINGAQLVPSYGIVVPPQNYVGDWNKNATPGNIGRFLGGALRYLDGYLSDIHFIDGQALTPSDFGELNAEGVWVPKAYTGTYGNNGFHLDFSDGTSTTTLGYDAAGSNDWTLNGMTRAAGVNECWMTDTPTDNFATWSPLTRIGSTTASTFTKGNLNVSTTTYGRAGPLSTIELPTTGTWWGEFVVIATSTTNGVGVAEETSDLSGNVVPTKSVLYTGNGSKTVSGASSAYGTAYDTDDVIGCLYDADADTVTFYLQDEGTGNFISQGAISTSGLTKPLFFAEANPTTAAVEYAANFGQRTFNYATQHGSLPSAALPLSTANLPAVAIPDPSLHFDVVLDTGANIKTAMDALFSGNVFEWIKDRANSNNHQLADVNRGLTAILQSNTTAAETTYSAPSGSSVGWGWKAGGAGASNTDGSITSTVSANPTAGFSIVAYTGTGANATVGHGLGVAPKLVIVKQRNTVRDWPVLHSPIGSTKVLFLNSTAAISYLSTTWNNTNPTSSVFSIGTDAYVNQVSGTYLALAVAEIPGYSKIGSYTGNGAADGPFVHCGFRPRWILFKNASAGSTAWIMHDTEREAYNAMAVPLFASASNAEGSGYQVDVTANGFKLRSTDASTNGSTNTIIFAAFAEHPLGGSNVSPAPAR